MEFKYNKRKEMKRFLLIIMTMSLISLTLISLSAKDNENDALPVANTPYPSTTSLTSQSYSDRVLISNYENSNLADGETINQPDIETTPVVTTSVTTTIPEYLLMSNSNQSYLITESDRVSNFSNYDLRSTMDHFTKEDYSEYLSKYKGLSDKNLDTLLLRVNSMDVNPLFVLAVLRLESGNGTSDLALNYNNYCGVVSEDGSYTKYANIDDCIIDTSLNLKNNYLDPNGRFHKGYTIKDINYHYSETRSWHKSVESIMRDAQDDLIKIHNNKVLLIQQSN